MKVILESWRGSLWINQAGKAYNIDIINVDNVHCLAAAKWIDIFASGHSASLAGYTGKAEQELL